MKLKDLEINQLEKKLLEKGVTKWQYRMKEF